MEKWINLNIFSTLPIFNSTTRVMHKLLMLAVREENQWKVYLNTNIREQIMKDCNVPKASYCRAIKELEDCNFLARDKDICILNLLSDYDKMSIIFKR
mgnify:CR=1 FL=1